MSSHASFASLVPVGLQVGLGDVGLPVRLLLWLTVGLGSLLAAAAFVILGGSVYRAWRAREQHALRPRIRDEIIERTYAPETAWDEWVAGLSPMERAIAEEELDGLLRLVEGSETDALADLAVALDIPQRARQAIVHGSRYERLDGLTWLTLLNQPVAPGVLLDHCTGTPDERAAAARLLYASDHPRRVPVGLDLLLADPETTLPVFGLDTLYRLAQPDPTLVVERTIDQAVDWDPELLIQVLFVMAEVSEETDSTDVEWLTTLLDHEAPGVRAEAARSLSAYAGQDTPGARIDLDSLVADSDSRVRVATYEMLGEWGSREALDALERSAPQESDPLARVAAAEALCDHPTAIPDDPPAALQRALRWVVANRAVRASARPTVEHRSGPTGWPLDRGVSV